MLGLKKLLVKFSSIFVFELATVLKVKPQKQLKISSTSMLSLDGRL